MSKHRQTLLRIAKACGLFALARRLTRRQLRILCYHGIWLGDGPVFKPALFMRKETFAGRMTLLKRLGYPVLPLDEAVTRLAEGTLPDNAVVITIDDAWYGAHAHMLPALEAAGFSATFYVTTYYVLKEVPVLNILADYMAERAPAARHRRRDLFPDALEDDMLDLSRPEHRALVGRTLRHYVETLDGADARWAAFHHAGQQLGLPMDRIRQERWFDLMRGDELRATRDAGFHMGLHTHKHGLKDFNTDLVRREVTDNRRHLSALLNMPEAAFDHFCYPSGRYGGDVFNTLRKLGITSATTTDHGLNDADANPYALKRLLDDDGLTDLDMEAQLCGFWSLAARLMGK